MQTFNSALSGRGLLAAAIALLSSPALAETAGRVTFVTGEVTASAPDGSTRNLQRGDTINGGDRISTRAGRLQIRFTDGGFVSLQPNSVFGVDEYLYSNRKPEETSLFFSLIQGGMRTITGTIGKVNKQSYKVRTPVATIGIRGTEYLASLNDNGLTVSVGAGFVYVENGLGNVTGGAGQNIAVRDKDSAPGLGRDKAEVKARGVKGDRAEEDGEQSREDRTPETVAIGNVQNERGDYLLVFKHEAEAGFVSGGGYTAAYSAPGAVNTAGGYDDSALSEGSDNSLHVAFDPHGSMEQAYQYNSENIIFSRDMATDAGNGAVGALKWGAWTYNGIDGTTPVTVGGSSVSLAQNEYAHYIVGRMTPLHDFLSIPFGGQATYTIQGGTQATGSDGSFGTIDPGSQLIVNFSYTPSVSANIGVTMDDATHYQFSGTTSVAMSMSPASPSFPASVSGMPTFASSGMSCTVNGSAGCSASISGFFAGAQAQQIGLSYEISDALGGRTVNGTGAFGRGPVTFP